MLATLRSAISYRYLTWILLLKPGKVFNKSRQDSPPERTVRYGRGTWIKGLGNLYSLPERLMSFSRAGIP
ncbi:MAG: hypothetical protein K9J27_00060 [Bacteroidales bacterium]|nr:hypothetical protein [Bacteroidales bacterium]MCF8333341.1 hypothetical protein [Bacteroidales bacterium]